MLFNSLGFLLFFPVVTTIYFLLPHRFRWCWLLGASCYFYMSFVPIYILILLLTIVIDYFAALRIDATEGRVRKAYLTFSILSTVLILFVFKYFNFANENLAAFAHLIDWNYPISALKLVLPIGLSFHTFQSLAYVVEVYRGEQKPERHFGIYSLYVMFYPQLVAGPIERPQNLLHQFHERHDFDAKRFTYGLTRIAYGLFKKVVIADRLAAYVNQVYQDVPSYTTIPILLAVFFFAIQVYCDFSGYSDIAVGTAQVIGFDLMENFDRPYLSTSVTEFWRRWHRSLSTWFNDYVFTPMFTALREWGNAGLAFALFCTFMLSGLWHGAGWTFVVYGALHGVALIFEALTKKQRKRWAARVGQSAWDAIGRASMFLFVSMSFIFFRAASLRQALDVVGRIVRPHLSFNLTQVCAGMGPFNLMLCGLVIVLLFASYRLPKTLRLENNLGFVCGATAMILLLGKGTGGAFIYFQF
jgi:alginate O-acetyltransferase complex protein AlgI